MKNITAVIILFSIFSITGGCNNEVDNHLPSCAPSLIGQDVKFYSNQKGLLTFTDTIPGLSFPFPEFFIFSDKSTQYFFFSDSVSYLPLTPCNLPENDFNFALGDKINILFSGNLMIYPPTIDAFSVPFELTEIQQINEQEK